VTVPGTADIFASGHSTVDQAGGTAPPSVSFSAGINQVVTVSASGQVTCAVSQTSPYNGPDGPCYTESSTNINPYKGISGIVDGQSTYFLVGVFLDNSEPADPAPSPLNFSTTGQGQNAPLLQPQLRQVFFIGDGLAGTGSGGTQQQILAPSGATRLFLGFADACHFQGNPDC
jgi:hypothetical protein